MLISFTQTYGDERRQLLDIYSRDQKLVELKNLFDINYYSFHNSSDETVKYFENINTVKNTKILRFNNISYTKCIESLVKILEEDNCTHFFFSQDDTFSKDNDDVDFAELVSYFKSQQSNFMYCLGRRRDAFKVGLNELKILKNLILYENNSLNYKSVGWGGMDDESYLCTFDMMKKIYDDSYFAVGDIWKAEGNLTRRFGAQEIPRHVGDKALLCNYNILGKNIWAKNQLIEELKEKKFII